MGELHYGKFIQDIMYQSLSELAKFCRRQWKVSLFSLEQGILEHSHDIALTFHKTV